VASDGDGRGGEDHLEEGWREDRCVLSVVLRLTGINIQELNISCQLQDLENNKEKALFDLHTVGFWALKNPTLMEDVVTNQGQLLD
jgi:hypothetical protein